VISQAVKQQYMTTDLLRIRVDTHVRYSERHVDLHAECVRVLGLTGSESLLDVGCGPGMFPRHLRAHGHTGRLAGLDQSGSMIAEATRTSTGLGIEWFTGVAGALPFAEGQFDVVSARHMLYHVPDIRGALREFARVGTSGGRVLAVTNGRHVTPHLADLQSAMLAHFGLPALPDVGATFNGENAPDILREVFPAVEEANISNALVFTEAAPIVDYAMTMMQVQQVAEDPDRLAAVHEWLTAEATRRLAAMGGIWRDPKEVALYVCRAA
jgi:ubiquinone/menaquinone biosynthesis C-methylase UbiE